MDDLIEFLTSRYDEDEQTGREAIHDAHDDGRWAAGVGHWLPERIDGLGITIYDEGGHSAEQAAHIVRWNPSRVLADITAKRAVLALHSGEHECVGDRHGRVGTVMVAPGYIHENCPTLVVLAQPYSEHPDFRPEWRVSST